MSNDMESIYNTLTDGEKFWYREAYSNYVSYCWTRDELNGTATSDEEILDHMLSLLRKFMEEKE